MSLAEQIARAKADYDEVYEAGKQTAYDGFWDVYQDNGNRTDFQFAFGGKGWNDSTFKPKHSIQITAAREMFNGCKITNLKSILDMQNVTFDFSKCTDFTLFLSNSDITHFGVLDCTAIKNVGYLLYEAKKLVYLEKLIIAADGSQTFTDQTFGGAIALKDIIVEGVFGSSVKMLQQPLSRASLESVIAALSTTATGQTLTVRKSAVEAAFTTEEWETLVATRSNWTITLYG